MCNDDNLSYDVVFLTEKSRHNSQNSIVRIQGDVKIPRTRETVLVLGSGEDSFNKDLAEAFSFLSSDVVSELVACTVSEMSAFS